MIFDRDKCRDQYGMSQERMDFFSKREKEQLGEQPDLERLWEKLLNINGCAVVPRFEPKYEIEKIISRGERFEGREATLRPMCQSECHHNSASLFKDEPQNFELYTGYALTEDDGLWRQHTWLVKKRTGDLVETTERRKVYFGYKMTDSEQDIFTFEHCLI